MGRMSDLEIALHEQVGEETEAEILEGIGYRFLKLAEVKRRQCGEEASEDRLTNTYETDESLEAKDAFAKANPGKPTSAMDYPEPEVEKPIAEEPKPTLESVRKVLAELSRAGHTADVKAIIQSHGCQRLSEVDPKDYPALLKEAEEIGHGS